MNDNLLRALIHLIGFISVVLATSTFAVSSWIVYTSIYGATLQDFELVEFATHQQLLLLNNATVHDSDKNDATPNDIGPRFLSWFMKQFEMLFVISSVEGVVISLIQFAASSYLLAGNLEEFHKRGRHWIVVSMGVTLMYALCLIILWTFPRILKESQHYLIGNRTFKYFHAFYTALLVDIIALLCLVIMSLGLLRCYFPGKCRNYRKYSSCYLVQQHI